MIIMALFVLTLGVVSVASLITGKLTPWSSQPVYFRQRPVVFLAYVSGCLIVMVCLIAVLRAWFG
ncbi:hypothetical protein C7H08_10365 [Marinobacter halophilus]|uniref:Uncharacterized protein n=1 Tax=Marinobacter halophilus TaxID=1323740 RepID=A0A2T1KCG1_9GAMM|nr:hypothetical protein C7H08_10365 [Marinobacter halophilus]